MPSMLDTKTRTLPTILSSVIACAALTFVGCGDDEDGSRGGTFSSGVPSATPINEMTQQQRDDFCAEAEAFGEDFFTESDLERFTCLSFGLIAGAFEGGAGACQEAFDACLENPPPPDEAHDDSTCALDDVDDDCDVTVGEYETCLNDTAALTLRLIDDLSCDTVDWGSSDVEAFGETPESCRAFEERCGGF